MKRTSQGRHVLIKFISVLLISCFLINTIPVIINNSADAASSITWALDDWYNNPYLEVKRIEDDRIILWGEHNKKKNVNYYVTDGFVMTTEPYVKSGDFPSTARNNYINSDKKPISDDGTNIIMQYSIKFEDLVGMAGELGKTGESIGNGTLPIYLHVIYDIYKGDELVVDNVIGVQEMINAPVKYLLGYTSWAEGTLEKIRSYYNMRFDLSVKSTYKVNVIAVDQNDNPIKDNPLLTIKSIYKQSFAYDIPTSIEEGGIEYKFDNLWKYSYTSRTSKPTIKSNNYDTQAIKINKMPDALPGSTMTIKIRYKKVSSPYYVKIVAVDTKGAVLFYPEGEDKKYTVYNEYDFLNGQPKEVPASWFTYLNKYKYQHKWYLKYSNNSSSGSEIKKGSVNQTNIYYTMPDAKPGSTAYFCLVYDTIPITPPPTSTPAPTTVATPTPTLQPTPTLVPQEVIVPKSDAASLEFTEVVNKGVINPDIRHSERFISTLGVPTTESLYGQVTARDYLLGYSFVKKVGIKYFPVTITKYYTLSYYSAPDAEGVKKLVTKNTSVSQTVSVPRAYGYWEIVNFDCFKIDNAVLKNYSLPDGSITLTPNYTYYNPPTVGIYHSDQMDYHVMPPDEAVYGISLYASLSSSGSTMPSIKSEDFTSVALARTGKAKVRSDYLSFNNTTIISDTICETEAPDINELAIPQCKTFINENVLYKPDQIIEAKKLNGKYDSSGVITYTAIARINSKTNEKPQYNIEGINDVVIHTPVVCNPQITADNDKYVQLINPTKDCTQLVLDPDDRISDFTVYISNYGPHSNKLGYYTRDFSQCLRDPTVSYIAKEDNLLLNQVKFPFDVYQDTGRSYDCSDDTFIKAGSWITMSRNTLRFYLPMTVNEGVYTANFRTIAVNGSHLLDKMEVYANTELYHYVATNMVNFEVSGRIYGLTVYDISDYPLWKEVFRVPNSSELKKNLSKYVNGTALSTFDKGLSYNYTVGTNDQYGNDTGRNVKYTFPLINGSHPLYKNIGILKTGYMVRFSLETTGNMFSDACMVNIKPNFYYVDKNGKNRTAVDLYYTEEINGKCRNLVKIGSAMDKVNLKSVKVGDLNLGIPEAELKQTARLRGVSYNNLISKSVAMFNFSEIRLNWGFRTYVNNQYLNKIKSYTSFEHLLTNKITESSILERLQKWYGQYYIPNRVHAVKKDFDVMDYADKYGVDDNESIWLDDGYIIVNFTIETVSEDGKRRLSYINASNYQNNSHCSMWVMEGAAQTKSSNKGPAFNFYAGDFMIYYTDKKMSDDYKSGAIY